MELDLECTERCPEVESLPAYMAALALNPGMDLSADTIYTRLATGEIATMMLLEDTPTAPDWLERAACCQSIRLRLT